MTLYGFTPQVYWQRIPTPDRLDDCYAGLNSKFYPMEERAEWFIPGPFQGETFVVLSTGGFGEDGSIIKSTISQKISLNAGEQIIGACFFGTTDYSPYNDYEGIYLELVDPNEYTESVEYFEITDSLCSLDSIGSFMSTYELSPETGGWIEFSHVVEPNQVGPYYLRCQVADLNNNWFVEPNDLSIFSEQWLINAPNSD